MTEKELEEMEKNPDGLHACPKCGKEVFNERAIAVKTMRCIECTPQGFKPKATFISGEKEGEGGSFEVQWDEHSFNAVKHAYADTSDEEETAEAINKGEKMKTDD